MIELKNEEHHHFITRFFSIQILLRKNTPASRPHTYQIIPRDPHFKEDTEEEWGGEVVVGGGVEGGGARATTTKKKNK